MEKFTRIGDKAYYFDKTTRKWVGLEIRKEPEREQPMILRRWFDTSDAAQIEIEQAGEIVAERYISFDADGAGIPPFEIGIPANQEAFVLDLLRRDPAALFFTVF